MLHTTLKRAAALLVTLVALAACDSQPTAPAADATMRAAAVNSNAASVYRTSGTLPTSFVIYTPCANAGQGEVLQVNTQVEYSGQWVTNPRGERVHHIFKANYTGSAVGWDTGDTYDVVTREWLQGALMYGSDGIVDSGNEKQRVRVELTSRMTGAVFSIVLTSRFVQSATGEFVVDVIDATTRCN